MIPLKRTILGGGAFGSAMAHVASFYKKGTVSVFVKDKEEVNKFNANRIHQQNTSKYYNDNIFVTDNLNEALKDTQLIISCLPTQIVTNFVEQNIRQFPLEIPFVSCSKGMDIKRQKFLSECLAEVTNNQLNYCMLSGPSFAEEILKDCPTCVVVASQKENVRTLVQRTLSNKFFRIYTQNDLIGVEIAGALKNTLAIGAGIAKGNNLGYNAQAALLTRGTKEIQQFAIKYGAQPGTLSGLAGIGDIMLTAYGSLSRNMAVGYRLGQGEKLEHILKTSNGIVEGIPTLEAVVNYSQKNNIELPIFSSIDQVIKGNISIQQAIDMLMSRELEPEYVIDDQLH